MGRKRQKPEEQEAAPQMAETMAADSSQEITIGQPEQQSAELTTPTIDTLKTLPR